MCIRNDDKDLPMQVLPEQPLLTTNRDHDNAYQEHRELRTGAMGCTGQPSESNRLPQETIPGFENLPEVLKMEVLLRLDPASLCCIACVNRPFRALANSILDDWRPQLIKKVQEAFRETVSQAAAAPTLVTLLMAGVVAYRDLPSWQRRDDRSLLAFCQRHAYATTNNSEWRVASHLISALVLGQHPVEHTSQNLLPAGNTPMDAYDKFYISLLVKLSITSYLMEKSMT
ncbi:hypothetical protein WJX72_010291 [[Myrmecia] bisecta]|uniref:F-box domain-containing protein n=1 Tax=[Myrmecia] bisecta TaxID=41462 RepID=A0AAW1QSI8_9CHLO